MEPDDAPDLHSIGSELRAQRLGFALRSLAADLVDERRQVAQLRREVADLRARLSALEVNKDGHEERPPASSSRARRFKAASGEREGQQR